MKLFSKKWVITLCALLGVAFLSSFSAFAGSKPKGEIIYDKHCSVCHTKEPPPKMAPPIFGVGMHYHQAFKSKEKAVAHMIDFMMVPDSSKSRVNPRAIRRFGVMPAINLSKADLKIVSEWVWDQFDPNSPLVNRCK